MLGFPILYCKGMRPVMFQLSGFCYITPSLQARPALGDTSTKCTHFGVLWSLRVEEFRLKGSKEGFQVFMLGVGIKKLEAHLGVSLGRPVVGSLSVERAVFLACTNKGVPPLLNQRLGASRASWGFKPYILHKGT